VTAERPIDGEGPDRAVRLQAILARFRRVWAQATDAQKDRLLAVLERVVELTDRELAAGGPPPGGDATAPRPGPSGPRRTEP
jgi:hypothetical protein